MVSSNLSGVSCCDVGGLVVREPKREDSENLNAAVAFCSQSNEHTDTQVCVTVYVVLRCNVNLAKSDDPVTYNIATSLKMKYMFRDSIRSLPDRSQDAFLAKRHLRIWCGILPRRSSTGTAPAHSRASDKT